MPSADNRQGAGGRWRQRGVSFKCASARRGEN